jgi:hypothetical protein
MRSGMTIEELFALPVTLDIEVAGRAWMMGRTKAYALARNGEFPCPVLRVGRAYRVTRADLFRALGIDPEHPGQAIAADLSGDAA